LGSLPLLFPVRGRGPAFEKKPGKIERVNRGVSTNIVERKLTFQQSVARSGVESWQLLNEASNAATKNLELTAIKRGSSAAELLTWCHFNKLINPGTILSLDTKVGSLQVEEVKNMLEALEQQFPNGAIPDTSMDDLEKPPAAVSACLFINVGTDPLRGNSRRGNYFISEDKDILNPVSSSSNLALTFDLVVVTSWQEILTYRYSGIDGMWDCLCQLLRWNIHGSGATRKNFAAFNFSFAQGSMLVDRVEELFKDVLSAYFKNSTLKKDVRYILEAQQSFFVINYENDNFYYLQADTEREFFNKLSEPREGDNQFVVDRRAFEGTILADVLAKNAAGKIQLCYEVVGQLANIYVLDEQGRAEKSCHPLHDATLGDADEVFILLVEYLRNLEIHKASRVIFVGDGASWIWNRVQLLLDALSLRPEQVFQVVDYFHAAAHLWSLLELREDLTFGERKRVYEQWKSLLWKGDIAGLRTVVMQMARGKARKKMLKGLEYFDTHACRMQYQSFKAQNVPQGSGCVESAIRRVINLRLKAAGTFWTPAMAEYFLFLRSQLLSGRWSIFITNVATRRHHQWGDNQVTTSDFVTVPQHSTANYGNTKAAA